MHESKPQQDGPVSLVRRRAAVLPQRPGVSETRDKLLQCIACDYGTHALLLETLIEMLIGKGIMTEDEFEELLQLVDRRDGRIDGTLGQPAYIGEGI